MYNVHLSLKSNNAKTGPIPVSTTSFTTCPVACPFRSDAQGGCYAAAGPLALHWRAVTEGRRGTDWGTFVGAIAALPEGTVWRHNQAGDLPGDGTDIDGPALRALVTANRGRRGFTYTHYNPTAYNAACIRAANARGFVINLSGNDVGHADRLADLGIGPVVTVLPTQYARTATRGDWAESIDAYRARVAALPQRTPSGRRVVVCPATYRDDVSCATCQLCARAERTTIVGFPAHGSSARRADQVARRVINIRAEA